MSGEPTVSAERIEDEVSICAVVRSTANGCASIDSSTFTPLGVGPTHPSET
jgi:hypothetical protein